MATRCEVLTVAIPHLQAIFICHISMFLDQRLTCRLGEWIVERCPHDIDRQVSGDDLLLQLLILEASQELGDILSVHWTSDGNDRKERMSPLQFWETALCREGSSVDDIDALSTVIVDHHQQIKEFLGSGKLKLVMVGEHVTKEFRSRHSSVTVVTMNTDKIESRVVGIPDTIFGCDDSGDLTNTGQEKETKGCELKIDVPDVGNSSCECGTESGRDTEVVDLRSRILTHGFQDPSVWVTKWNLGRVRGQIFLLLL